MIEARCFRPPTAWLSKGGMLSLYEERSMEEGWCHPRLTSWLRVTQDQSMPDFVWRRAATASGQNHRRGITSAVLLWLSKLRSSQGLAPISLDDQALAARWSTRWPLKVKGFCTCQAKVDKGAVKAADVLALSSGWRSCCVRGLLWTALLRVLIEMSQAQFVFAASADVRRRKVARL